MTVAVTDTYPFGWFAVAFSGELARSQVCDRRYFGRDLVVWRTEDGIARVAGAYCPHLGAHLGRGGAVVGEELQCPFHGFRFAADGACTAVPYSGRVPRSARLSIYPTVECAGMVFIWFHPDGAPPVWPVSEPEEFNNERWQITRTTTWTVDTTWYEAGENSVDIGHLQSVHSAGAQSPQWSVYEDGYYRRLNWTIDASTPDGPEALGIDVEAFGPGMAVVRHTGLAEVWSVASATPIDMQRIDLRLLHLIVRRSVDRRAHLMGRLFVADQLRQVGGDISIWENKIHLSQPALVPEDGHIRAFRRWARQFVQPDGAAVSGASGGALDGARVLNGHLGAV